MVTDNNQGLQSLGLKNLGGVHWNLPARQLFEEAIRRHEGVPSPMGPLVINTAPYTGRLPQDKFIVREPSSSGKIDWGKINQPFEPARFEALRDRIGAYLQKKDIFVQDCYAGADERYRIPIRVISQRATGAAFLPPPLFFYYN